jgi:YVTN family beta-propeller protein
VPNSNLNESRNSKVKNFAVQWAILAMGLGASAWPGEAMARTGQPLAYVASSNGISVIDTGDNQVVDSITGFVSPAAVTPDGQHIYASGLSNSEFEANILEIDATNDEVVATIPLNVSRVENGVSLGGASCLGVTPDGKHLYATTGLCSKVSFDCFRPESVYFALWVIDTATNKVVDASPRKGIAAGIAFSPDGQATYLANYDPYTLLPQVLVVENGNVISLPGFGTVRAIAIAPDGKRVYVTYVTTGTATENVSVIDAAAGAVVNTIQVGTDDSGLTLFGIAATPDGKYVYVTSGSNSVAVIETASNTVVKTVVVGANPSGVAVTPDGRQVYVTNPSSNSVSVINTASNTVVTTVPVPVPSTVSIIIPPAQGVPFLSFNAKLDIHFGHPKQDSFDLVSSFVLGRTTRNGIHPDTEPVKLQVGPFIVTIPAGSFMRREERSYAFAGIVDGVRLEARIELRGGFHYAFRAHAKGANLSGTTNPVQVSLGIGGDAGLTSVTARFDRNHPFCNDWTDRWR